MSVSRRVVVASLGAVTLAGCERAPDYVNFTHDKRVRLLSMRNAEKFKPENSELPDDSDDKVELNQIINACLDAILIQPNGRLDGEVVREQFMGAVKKLDHFAPEESERAIEYMVEIWRILGFRTRTGVLGEPSAEPGALSRFKRLLDEALAEIRGSKK